MKVIYVEKKGQDEINSYLSASKESIYSENRFSLHPIIKSNTSGSDSPKDVSTYLHLKQKLLDWLKEIFLPQGYPHSVSPDYLQYQFWDSLQAYCSNLAGALSLHSTLVGIGVGKEAASPLSAAVSWLTKDGAGMISSITFAYYKGCELDYNNKQWRLFADVANDSAHFLNLLAPVLPFPFLLTFCCSSVMSSMVGVAGGATRASLIQHQALRNNMADVSAKDGSQETLVNLAGLVTSLTLLPILTSTPVVTWVAFLLMVLLHLYSNLKAMRAIRMRSLNRPRSLLIFESLSTLSFVPDVGAANDVEPLVGGAAFVQDFLNETFRLELGVSLTRVKDSFSGAMQSFDHFLSLQIPQLEKDKYLIFVRGDTSRISVVYHEAASHHDVMQSFWVAYLCAANCQRGKERRLCPEYQVSGDVGDFCEYVERVKKCAQSSFPELVTKLTEKGWQLNPIRMKIGEWRLARGGMESLLG